MGRWHNRNGQRWRVARRRALERDNWTCQGAGCGKQLGLAEVDHIKPVSQGGAEFDPANLQTLCRRCHMAKTRAERPGPPPDPERERWKAYLIDTAENLATLGVQTDKCTDVHTDNEVNE